MKKYFTLFTVVFTLLFITTYTQAQTQIFKVGDKAPLFSATTHNGQSFDLKKQLENSSVILLF
jgi:peroxiredoxin